MDMQNQDESEIQDETVEQRGALWLLKQQAIDILSTIEGYENKGVDHYGSEITASSVTALFRNNIFSSHEENIWRDLEIAEDIREALIICKGLYNLPNFDDSAEISLVNTGIRMLKPSLERIVEAL